MLVIRFATVKDNVVRENVNSSTQITQEISELLRVSVRSLGVWSVATPQIFRDSLPLPKHLIPLTIFCRSPVSAPERRRSER